MEISASEPDRTAPDGRSDLLVFLLCGVALTAFFWWPLVVGYGIIGGDTYTYFFPQKTYYADWLKQGVLPLWNHLVGFGYPIVGESQTGVFYPFYLFFYRLLSVNAAYNANHLLHTVIGFVGMGFLARASGLKRGGAILAACVFVFGWFPARSCLEWAIVTGCWVPWQLWCVLRFLKCGQHMALVGLAGITSVQLLAGHYNLAFISVLACLGLAVWGVSASSETFPETSDDRAIGRRAGVAWTVAAVGLGFLLSALQLVPSYELKRQSQRATVEQFGEVGQGHLPPWYLIQTLAPFIYYDAFVDTDALLNQPAFLSYPHSTNRVEAHLYFGLVPLGLALFGCCMLLFRGSDDDRVDIRLLWFWCALGCAALIYATGWLVPIAQYLPGFSYFRGPGRYTILTTISVAMFAGWSLDRLLQRFDPPTSHGLACLILAISILDLYLIGRNTLWMSGVENVNFWNGNGTGYTVVVARPALALRQQSQVAELMSQFGGQARVFAPGPNLATVTGVSATPVYLGIGPQQYFDEALTMPAPPEDQRVQNGKLQAIPSQVEWLRRASVSHVLSFDPLDQDQWPVTQSWQLVDPFFARAWGRNEPIYLSQLSDVRARLSWRDALRENDRAATTITLRTYEPNRVEIDTFVSQENQLIMTDLAWPGWVATIDGTRVPIKTVEGQFRGIDVPRGQHLVVMRYRPWSLWLGGFISLLALLILIVAAVESYRRRPAV